MRMNTEEYSMCVSVCKVMRVGALKSLLLRSVFNGLLIFVGFCV